MVSSHKAECWRGEGNRERTLDICTGSFWSFKHMPMYVRELLHSGERGMQKD